MTKYQEYSERELIRLLKLDDHQAFKVLYDRYVPKLYSFIESYFGNAISPGEAVQEAFIKIWEKREYIDEHRSLNPYLIQIMKNRVYNSYRESIQAQKYQNYRKNLSVNSDSTNEYILYRELEANIKKGIESLPPVQKQVFKLSREQGLSHDDIALNLKISKRTVEQHIYQALKHLKKASYQYNLHTILTLINIGIFAWQ